ncbi:MAG: lamin tail domain-containing protein [Candidatus Aenigmarchaeota archaeon]|nr:lamin tail domain-containing protein [Candidatus Aenigmarchaeota archaeon]
MRLALILGMIVAVAVLPPAGAVVISEVLYDPAGTDGDNEFLELYNPSPQDADLAGWAVEFGDGFTGTWNVRATLNNSRIPAFGFFLIGEANVSGRDVTATLDLEGGPDAVRIKNAQGAVVDTVGYGALNFSNLFEGSPAPDVAGGHSLERRPGFLQPLAGNGQDTQNNSADFLDNPVPEPQNSAVRESGSAQVQRIASPSQPSYLPGASVAITLNYTFFSSQVGLIVRERNPFGIQNPSPVPDVVGGDLHKWLLRDRAAIPAGVIQYTFTLPATPGAYTLSGDWEAVDPAGFLSAGETGNSTFNVVTSSLEGFVEDVLGGALANATVATDNASAQSSAQGFYSLPLPDLGIHRVDATKSGYLGENVTLDFATQRFYNFTGNSGLIPLQLSDTQMLVGVRRWSADVLDDITILEVIHQWASSPA